jgi:myo-inositol 2-dehydrogenase/D-chiro-inositol 1-dehydrogenase
MSDRAFRFVVLGLGFAGSVLHLPALRRLPGVEVVAAADPSPLARAAAPLPATAGWREALEVEADAVLVATPPETHVELAEAALAMGRHVYLEKPMATSRGECERLADLAALRGVTLQLGFAYRFHPLWRRARGLLASGVLQRPLQIDGVFAGQREREGWLDPIVDLSCHHVDLVSWLLGAAPVEVAASADGSLHAAWPDGSELEGRYPLGPPQDRVQLTDRRRTLVVDRLRGTRLHGSGLPMTRARLPVPSLLRAHAAGSGWERSFEWALQAFVESARAGRTGEPGAAAGVAAFAAADAIFRSLASGRPEPVAVELTHA